jgi:hypothetical protein
MGPAARGGVLWIGRLATFEWFAIGIVIFMDPQTCGWRVLQRYATALFGWF